MQGEHLDNYTLTVFNLSFPHYSHYLKAVQLIGKVSVGIIALL